MFMVYVSLTTSRKHCKDTASKTPNSCHYSKGKTTSFSLLLLPTPNSMGKRRFHTAFILYKTLGYPELGLLGRKTLHIYAISMCLVNTVVCSIIDRLVPYYSIAIIVDVAVVLSIGVIGSKIIDKNKVTRICFSGSKK